METRTERFFPKQKFQPNQLLEYRFGDIIIRGRLKEYIIEGDSLLAVIRSPDGYEYADDQEKFNEVLDN